ncbi:hypothetical protein [Calothrix sp. CCY 0018]|uniref:hypothetical protein n=1 Tax=Calothrix sp. CCY 0018 TaxID=3103864 RepID=UPI0039C69F0A
MDRGKIVAIITGVFSILLAVAYLILVQILDFRGEMKPAPITQVETLSVVATFDGLKDAQIESKIYIINQ